MLEAYATGLIGITAVLLLWAFVQTAWRRAFPALSGDPDALAGRVGCSGCERIETCARADDPDVRDEEKRP